MVTRSSGNSKRIRRSSGRRGTTPNPFPKQVRDRLSGKSGVDIATTRNIPWTDVTIWPARVMGVAVVISVIMMLTSAALAFLPVASSVQVIRITVHVQQAGHDPATYIVNTRHGLLTEALSAVAAGQHTTFMYTTRGHSMYMWSYLGQQNDISGQWRLTVNGLPVTDMAGVTVAPSDHILLAR